ncbi:hypothetical protein FACS1894122_00530 [Alphaproteobacteria bacterium]|nr:hypothetical protein FACS1894122_00530 [Alphaproteobacteria bacterium]
MSARLEAEYRFASKKTFNGKYNISSDCNHDAVNAHINVLGNTELKAKTTGGWNVRALVVYNINCL